MGLGVQKQIKTI